jgi:hypothetical protein
MLGFSHDLSLSSIDSLRVTISHSCNPAIAQFDTDSVNRDSFGYQQCAFEHFVPAVSAEPPAGGDHAVARHVGTSAVPHDVADRSRRARFAGERRDVAVGRHPAPRNTSHRSQDARREIALHRMADFRLQATGHGSGKNRLRKISALPEARSLKL